MACHRIVVAATVFVLGALLTPRAASAGDDVSAICASGADRAGEYDPGLRTQVLKAFAKQFPQAASMPDDNTLHSQARLRCASGHLLVCFIGANLPCGQMNVSRDNPGASAFCRSNPGSAIVPAVATGHDTIYSFTCKGGQAAVTGQSLQVDAQGYAKEYWSPVE